MTPLSRRGTMRPTGATVSPASCSTAATCAELGESCVELDCCDGQCVEIEEDLVCEDCLPQGAECSVQEDLCCPQHFCDDETSLCVHVE